MSSLIPGYEYDIFISYRQKDNKGDGWVSKFVDALKTELEATFKDDISVYFDENPHDRLQETHNVDKSLEGKLKCLIFIPILSQTYCDTKSYAWQYEFLTFLRMVESDRFGRDVKLKSGNVASRILPIRINDLDAEDVKLFERETGSVLRAMDFVFKTASGVNRSLKTTEDHPNDNLNKTYYSDQINKVALAIKEIILGLKAKSVVTLKESVSQKVLDAQVYKEDKQKDEDKPVKLNKRKLLSGVAILVILILAAVFIYSKIFSKDNFADLRSSDGRISVAVMPFQNMTNDTIWNVWQDGIQNNLISSLSNSEELKVRQMGSINNLIQNKGLTNYASLTPAIASSISQKLDASILIFGSITQAGTTIRVNAQLINSKTEETFKSFQIEGTSENILHIADSLSIIVNNFLVISKMEKERPLGNKYYAYTNSPEAYRFFMYGQKAFEQFDFSTARDWYIQAISIDSNFVNATLFLINAYSGLGSFEEAKKMCLKAYSKKDQMNIYNKLSTSLIYSSFFETPYEEIKWWKQLIEIDDQVPMTLFPFGNSYLGLDQYENAIPVFEKALEIYKGWDLKPTWVYFYTGLGYAYHKTGQYKKENKLYQKAEQYFPDDPDLIYHQTILSLAEGDIEAANRYLEKYKSIRKENSWPEADITTSLAEIYSEAGMPDKAEKYYREALKSTESESDNSWYLNNLAYFLIDKDRNIEEGMTLIDKVLKLSPDNYSFLDSKGWGFYKQGKHREAQDILQKSWDLRREKAGYEHTAFLHLEAAKKACANQK